MADASIINVNGTDYNIKDTLSRERSATAIQKITGDDTIEVSQSSTTRTLTVPLAVTLTKGGKTAVSADAIINYLEEHGLSITIDSALSETSENPVQNKVITDAINGKENAFTLLGKEKGGTGYNSFDTTPTQGSQKAVTSGGIYDATQNKAIKYAMSIAPQQTVTYKYKSLNGGGFLTGWIFGNGAVSKALSFWGSGMASINLTGTITPTTIPIASNKIEVAYDGTEIKITNTATQQAVLTLII
jgi:hypothetical protein